MYVRLGELATGFMGALDYFQGRSGLILMDYASSNVVDGAVLIVLAAVC